MFSVASLKIIPFSPEIPCFETFIMVVQGSNSLPCMNLVNAQINIMTLIILFIPSNDQDQRGEPNGSDGGTAIVEASAESTCWALVYMNFETPTIL